MLSFVFKTGCWAILLSFIGLLSTGCSWFKPRPEFEGIDTAKPLVIPPGMSKPYDREALIIPSKSLIGANAKSNEIVTSFLVKDNIDSVWKRIGGVLPTIEGVEVLNTVASIKSYEVRFGAETFLVNIQSSGNQTLVRALAPDGSISKSNVAGQLLAQLKLLVK